MPAVLVCLFFVVSCIGIVTTTGFSIAMENYGHSAGSASALLGLLSFVFGGIAAPFVGLGGSQTAIPMGVVIASLELLAILSYMTLARPKRKSYDDRGGIMKRVIRYFLNGLITVVPICAVAYVVVQLFQFLDNLLGGWIRHQIGQDYLPGFGILVSIILVTFIGWLATLWFTRRIFEYTERLLNRIPVIKSMYSIIKETLQSLVGEKRSFSKVALVRWPGTGMRVIGFITSEHVEQFGSDLTDHVAVYIPQSFQIAGITVIVPKSDVEILDIKVEDALTFILSAGASDSKKETTI